MYLACSFVNPVEEAEHREFGAITNDNSPELLAIHKAGHSNSELGKLNDTSYHHFLHLIYLNK